MIFSSRERAFYRLVIKLPPPPKIRAECNETLDQPLMRFFLYKLFNAIVCAIPAPSSSACCGRLHFHPDVPNRLGYQVYPLGFWNPFPDRPKSISPGSN